MEGTGPSRAWILTGSVENFGIYVERGFDVIGLKERRRRQASVVLPEGALVPADATLLRSTLQAAVAPAGPS
jgi:hypothetical protein